VGGFGFTTASAPFRFKRNGVLLACAIAAWMGLAGPGEAQVRTHNEAGGSFTISVTSWRDIPFRTVVRQQFDYSCGSAAVATLLLYHYGLDVREAQVFQSMYERGDQERIQRVGFSMLDMRAYLERVGFRADGLRLSLDRLAALSVPAIALITNDNYRHFVVIKGVSATHVLVGDPTFGLQTYTRAEFEAVWNGVVLAVRDAPPTAREPVYNAASEWRPWAQAPLADAPQVTSPSMLLLQMPELYQITAISSTSN
jgi:uncharacterized protein